MATWPFTDDTLSQAELLYVGYFGRAGDPGGTNFWVGELLDGFSLQAAAASFSVQEEAKAKYPLLANPLINSPANINAFLDEVYANLFARAADAGGKAYWAAYIQDAIDTGDPIIIANAIGQAILLISFGATGSDQTVLSNKVTAADFVTNEFAAHGINFTTELPPGTPENDANNVAYLFSQEAVHSVNLSAQSLAISENATTEFVANPPSGETFLLTVGQDSFHGTGRDLFNAPLAGVNGDLPTLTDLDNITSTGSSTAFGAGDPPFAPGFSQLDGYGPHVSSDGPDAALAVQGAFFGSVLNASFNTQHNYHGPVNVDAIGNGGGALNFVTGVNIRGIQTWNINTVNDLDSYGGTIVITGGGPNSANQITGLLYLNVELNSGSSSLYIGDNAEPVQYPNGDLLETITVSDAVGTGCNGVDVDIAAQAFSGNDTLNVVASVVGGFPLQSSSNGFTTSLDVPKPITGTYGDPDDYCVNWRDFGALAYAVAAGASSGPTPDGFVGPDDGAVGYANWNVYSTNAWRVEGKIPFGTWTLQDSTGQKGGVNILALGGEGSTSAETLTLHDDGSSTILFSTYISDSEGGKDWQNLTDINLSDTTGFVVLSGLEYEKGLYYDYGSNDGGVPYVSAQYLGGEGYDHYCVGGLLSFLDSPITIEGGDGNSFYDLTSLSPESAAASSIDGGHGTNGNSEVAFNNRVFTSGLVIPTTNIQVFDDADDSQGGTIDLADFNMLPLNMDYTLLGGGLVPAGFSLLQLLGADGCTATELTSNLFIEDGPINFALNMQDVANGEWVYPDNDPDNVPVGLTGYNITIFGEQPPPFVATTDTLKWWVSDDGATYGTEPVDEDERLLAQPNGNVVGGTIFVSPVVEIFNYTNVDIYLPYESAVINSDGDSIQNWVVLGSDHFTDQPVPTVTNASVNFYDNTDDTGGSDPGGADNLVLGHTNFTDTLAPADIGHTTVEIDGISAPPDDPSGASTTINFFGHGTFEIGATNASVLQAASSAHLIMDLPATLDYHSLNGIGPALGIDVTGSEHGQNLLQGTSGEVSVIHEVVNVSDNGILDTDQIFLGVGSFAGALTAGSAVTFGGVGLTYIADTDGHGNYLLGDDVLTGGDGTSGHGVPFLEIGGEWNVGGSTTYTGNDGDNYFPEGGNDIVNISHDLLNLHYSTVWFAMYDVCNSGGPDYAVNGLFSHMSGDPLDPYWGPANQFDVGTPDFATTAGVYGQAITTVTGGVESYVDNYDNSLLTINGFAQGDASHGDIINFDVNDWATGRLTDNAGADDFTAFGLVEADGLSMALEGEHNADAELYNVGFAGEEIASPAGDEATIILDTIGQYDNATQLVAQLTQATVGNFVFNMADQALTDGSIMHVLVGYETTGGDMHIADVSLFNNTTTTGDPLTLVDTADTDVTVSAVDLINLVGVNIDNVHGNNFHFV